MKYKKRLYKYSLHEPLRLTLPAVDINSPYYTIRLYGYFNGYLRLFNDGTLKIFAGYAWDGPSGPSIDTKTFMRGSLVHDALYQLMREGAIPQEFREYADYLLYKICREDGMCRLRAWYVWKTVRWFAGYAARAKKPKILEAP